MKFSYMTAAFLELTQACSYTEQYWKNDPTCSGTPIIDEAFNGDDMNVCLEDEASRGNYGMLTVCSGGTFALADYKKDASCTSDPGVFSYPSGECKFDGYSGDDKLFAKFTITEAEVAPIKVLLNLI